jgi:hypothetical protein
VSGLVAKSHESKSGEMNGPRVEADFVASSPSLIGTAMFLPACLSTPEVTGWRGMRTNYMHRLSELEVPTLLVHGSEDSREKQQETAS